jgi:hypothetical protein
MLIGMLGLRLVLWIGKSIPMPAPPSIMTALTKVEVLIDIDGEDGFQMTFTLGKEKSLDYGLLTSGALDPDTRVVLGVLLGATPEPLINGVIYHHQIAPSEEPGMSTLTVSGRDISVLLDLEEKNEMYQNQPDSLIASLVVLRYAQYGIIPRATQTMDVPISLQRVPRQQETDLAFLRRLAKRNGYVFYIEPIALGTSVAYWGPEDRMSMPQPALTFNLGASSNIQTMHFANDALAPIGTKGAFVEPITKTSLIIPSLPSLKIPPLERNTLVPRRTKLMRKTANLNPLQAATAAIAEASNQADPIASTGTLDTVRYGSVLRARRLVGFRGAGISYNGGFYVRRVRHVIDVKQGNYTQEFKLSRGGTGSLLPVLRP